MNEVDSEAQTAPQAIELSTRDQILQAAAKVFLLNGYEGSSMDAVAAESGIGRRTVYNQFMSKKALFDATVASLWEGMPLERIIEERGSDSAPQELLRELGNAIAAFWASDQSVLVLRLIISESKRFPELSQSFFQSGRGVPRQALAQYLKQLARSKELSVTDADVAAAQFISLINGLLVWDRVIGGGPAPSVARQRHVVEEAVETFLSRFAGTDKSDAAGLKRNVRKRSA